MAYAEIEIALYPLGQNDYQVDLRVSDPSTEGVIEPTLGRATLVASDLLRLSNDFIGYGRALAAQLFADPAIASAWKESRIALDKAGVDIRVRLLIPPNSAALHDFRWELLVEPGSGIPISTTTHIIFSRFLYSRDWRPVRLRARGDLKALIAVANPTDLKSSYELAPIDFNDASKPFLEPLATLSPTRLGETKPVTLADLTNALDASPDILYLVCHGAILNNVPYLYLANSEGATEPTPATKLTEYLARLPSPPRLIVLASCQSAGFGEASTYSLAAELSKAGVPAVVAMQGNITMDSIREAMPVFFSTLLKDGQIDYALSQARYAILERSDAWMACLMMRLKSGRIWYDAGFKTDSAGEAFWGDLCIQVRKNKALPIIGPALACESLGDPSDIAQSIAQAEGFPLSSSNRNDLSKVTQYLSITKGLEYTQSQVLKQYICEITTRFPSIPPNASFADMLASIAQSQRDDPAAPLRILSHLDLSTFVNASSTGLLLHSLKAAAKEPIDKLARWRPSVEKPSPTAPNIVQDQITLKTPLLFGIFGDCEVPQHWVLTEDDFFDFTVRASQYNLLPGYITQQFCTNSLLFLGFDLDSWIFRALFRMIMNLDGIALQQGKRHIGVQLDPEDNQFTDPERAREYLISYFNSTRRGRGGEPQIEVFWGSSTDFLIELQAQLERRKDDPLPVESKRGSDD